MRRELWISIALCIGVLAVYGQTLGFEFVNWDDPEHVTRNAMVQRGLTLEGVAWALRAGEIGNWHPLTWLSHMLDVELFGANAGGHHATNVALHLLNSLLLFGVLRSATGAVWRSALVGALFALHPLHVESVAWVSERRDVLSTAFGLLAIGAYVAYARRGGVGRYLAVALCFAFSLMSKAMLVTLPFVLLLLDVWPLRRSQPGRRVLEKLPLLALALACSIAAFVTQRQASAVVAEELLPFGLRAANAVVAYAHYPLMLAWPTRLAMFYPHPYIPQAGGLPLATWQIAGAAACLLGATTLALRARERRYLAVGWLWYLGTLVPVIGLVQIGSQALADRYTYVPSIGLFIVVAWGGADLAAAARQRIASANAFAAGVAVSVLLALGVGAWLQTRHWRDSFSLFQHTVEAVPRNPLIRYNVANRLRDAGQLDAAIREYERALTETPDSFQIRINLANALRADGKLDEAAAHYRELLARDPDDAQANNGLATLLRAQGQQGAAERHYRLALARQPGSIAGYNLGNLLRSQDRLAEAIAIYRETLRHRARDPKLHNNLAAALEAAGDLDAALLHFRIALKLDPGYDLARRNLEHAESLKGSR
jgi:tetratricopeptide (TPR) repeat protein